MGNVIPLKRSRLVDKIYKDTVGIELSKGEVQTVRMYAIWLFDCTDAHLAIIKDKEEFSVIAIPYYRNSVTGKASFLNRIKSFYKKMFGRIKFVKSSLSTKELEYLIKRDIVKADFSFVRTMPEIDTLRLEEILNEQKNNNTP